MASSNDNYSVTLDTLKTLLPLIVAATLMLTICGGAWVLGGDGIDTAEDRSAFIRNMGLALVGVIGLPLAIWRSMIAQQQANASENQVIISRQQIAALEKNNLYQQLAKGAELLAEEESGKREAGVATLEAIGNSEDAQFSQQAMDLLAIFIQREYRHGHDPKTGLCQAAITALNRCGWSGIMSTKELVFSPEIEHADEQYRRSIHWDLITAAKSVRYFDGTFKFEVIQSAGQTKIRFFHSRFVRCTLVSVLEFSGCEFDRCSISEVSSETLKDNFFESCDFSGCRLYGFLPSVAGPKLPPMQYHDPLGRDRLTDCYYNRHSPPDEEILRVFGDVLAELDLEAYNDRIDTDLKTAF
ncbi:hypothetical protein [Hoeflea sp. TYP-13]|uniref:hypothetical protein n=1 Tax=Hoeflea sp. TYP-13 TaxID=3230023 RepID=UPI0034C67227